MRIVTVVAGGLVVLVLAYRIIDILDEYRTRDLGERECKEVLGIVLGANGGGSPRDCILPDKTLLGGCVAWCEFTEYSTTASAAGDRLQVEAARYFLCGNDLFEMAQIPRVRCEGR